MYIPVQAYQFDLTANEFTALPPMQTGRDDHGCGLIETAAAADGGAKEMVVAGGDHGEVTVERFNFGSQTWRYTQIIRTS